MMLAIPAINYMTHNGVFVIAHFHCVVMVTVFAVIGGVTFWFPKVFGFTLHETSGKWVFWLLVGGTFIVFTAMFILGLTGMPRRLAYVPYQSWWPILAIEEVGIFVDIAALGAFVYQMWVSIRDRELNKAGRDPWGTSRSLEWMTHSPVPAYNFAVIPHVNARDEWAWRRDYRLHHVMPNQYKDIELPVNTPVPMLLGLCAAGFGFAMIWRVWWLAIASLLAMIAIVCIRSFGGSTGTTIPAAEVERLERLAARPSQRSRPEEALPEGVVVFGPGSGEPAR